MKKILIYSFICLAILTATETHAAEPETKHPERLLKEHTLGLAAKDTSTLLFPTVLGVQTSERTLRSLWSSLDPLATSVYEDVSLRPPKGWTLTEEIDADGIYSTYIVNEDSTALLGIYRIRTADITLESMAAEIEAICDVCGYQILGKKNISFAGQQGKLFDIRTDTHRHQHYITVIDGVGYVIDLSAVPDAWSKNRKALQRSFGTLEFLGVENIEEFTFDFEILPVDTTAFESIVALVSEDKSSEALQQIIAEVKNPETHPLVLYGYSVLLFHFLENRTQAAFVYHLAQVRSGVYLDFEETVATRYELNTQIGEFINLWVGADIEAWKTLAKAVIAFDKKIGYPQNPLPDFYEQAEWEAIIDEKRAEYEAGMHEFLTPVTHDEMRALRAENDLPYGAWENPGQPLPAEWQ